MKKKKITVDIERKMSVGMIVSDAFLRDVQPIYDARLIQVPFVRTLAGWCIEHWEGYHKAPREQIGDILKNKIRRKEVPPNEQDLLEDFLSELSGEYEREKEKFNSEYWLDETEKYLDGEALRMLSEDVEALLSTGDIGQARGLVSDYKQVRRPTSQAVDPFENDALLERAFEEAQEPLFTLPGDVGKLLNPMFVRESLIGIMAPEKRGKTFLLTELGIHAAKKGCNVVFFSIGDMTETQMVRRIAMRMTGRNPMPQYSGIMNYPVLDCRHNQTNKCEREERPNNTGIMSQKDGKTLWAKYGDDDVEDYEPCTHCRIVYPPGFRGAHWYAEKDVGVLLYGHAKKAGAKFKKKYGDRWRLFVYESNELTSHIMQSDIEQLKDQEGFVPDVVIIDYADNMGPEDPRVPETRHRQNQTWMALSALRKRWHCCIITATQSDSASYDARDITMANFSEDKRKLSHVTAMLAINQTNSEKRQGVARLGLVVAREMEFHIEKQVKILQALRMGRPLVGSYLVK